MARSESTERNGGLGGIPGSTLPQQGRHKDKGGQGQGRQIGNPKRIRLDECEQPEQLVQKDWTNLLHQICPHLHSRTYFFPPLHFSRVQYSKTPIGNDVVQVTQPDDRMSDVRADETQRRIHNVMTSMFEGKEREPMVVCFSLTFDNYLNHGGRTKEKQRPGHLDSGHSLESERASVKRSSRTPSGQSRSALQQNGDHFNSVLPSHRKTHNRVPPSPDTPIPSSSSSSPSWDLSMFPRPRDLSPFQQRGEFDVLIIHPHRGLVLAEVKAVGDVFRLVSRGQSLEQQQRIICKVVMKSLRQLDKNEHVLKYLLQDLAQVPVTKVLMLPNLNRQTLVAALRQEPDLEQEFCQCLGAGSLKVALQRCVFSEQLPPIGHYVNAEHDVIKELYSDWWKPLVRETSSSCLDHDLYELVVARFCGPATKQYVVTATNPRAEITTTTQAVVETSRCYTAPILTPQQVDVLREASPRVMVTGPPGTGKRTMLTLKMKEWLTQGHTVLLISLWTASHAVSCYIYNKIKQETATEQSGHLRLVLNRKSHFHDVIKPLRRFRRGAAVKPWKPAGDHLAPAKECPSSLDSGFSDCVNWDDDEMEDMNYPDVDRDEPGQSTDSDSGSEDRHQQWTRLDSTDLHPQSKRQSTDGQSTDVDGARTSQKATDVHRKLRVVVVEAPWFLDNLVLVLDSVLGKDGYVIWAATSLPHPPPPSNFTCFEVTRNLRRPPVVVREMTSSPAYGMFLREKYSSQDAGVLSSMPFPTDGPPVKRIQHGISHTAMEVWDCELCGQAVAAFLTHDLKIGQFSFSPHTSEHTLSFSDVLISGRLPSLHDVTTPRRDRETDGMDCDTHTTNPPASSPGFLRGLERQGVSCDVMNKDDVKCYQTLAAPPDTDRVLVAEPDMVKGLERPVVVVLATTDFPSAVPYYVDPLFDVMGCCTSQLVIVGDARRSLVERLETSVLDTADYESE